MPAARLEARISTDLYSMLKRAAGLRGVPLFTAAIRQYRFLSQGFRRPPFASKGDRANGAPYDFPRILRRAQRGKLTMKKELDDLLCQRYPKIFVDRHLSVTESRMGLGFMCGDGWFELLDSLCRELQLATDENNAPQVVAVVVKEELGLLTFSCRSPNAAQRDMIGRAMDRSGHICEQCGQPGRRLKHHVLFTSCADHASAGAQPAISSVP